ncbi:MAG: transposase [bacterium]|nr:transposase [bacterium]
MKSAKSIRKLLKSCISDVDSQKNRFCSNSEKDFSRNRKLSFTETVNFILSMTVHSIPGELRQYFKHSSKMPTKSAFVQQRHKIAPEAFRTIFDMFTGSIDVKKSFRGYRLLACDGTSLNLPRNPADVSTSVHASPRAESYNILHLNALFDLLNKVYVDYSVDPGMAVHEAAALEEMAKRLPDPEKTIIVADRGYGNLPMVYRLSEIGSGS